MKRFLFGVCLGLLLAETAAAQTTDSAVKLPPYRYLFLVDTSSGMARQKEVAFDSIHKLILSGIGGRILVGDTFGIWTFNERVNPDAFEPRMWDPARRLESANHAYRFLRDQDFEKSPDLSAAIRAMSAAAKQSGTLTVFLFSSGTAPVNGTPFDREINAIFRQHASALRKAKRPFVTVLVAEEGKITAHSVNPGGGRIYIPPLTLSAQVAASNEAGKKPSAKATNSGAATPQIRKETAATKPLTVQEISERLRRAQTNRLALTITNVPAGDLTNKSEVALAAAQTEPPGVEFAPTRSAPKPEPNKPNDAQPTEATPVRRQNNDPDAAAPARVAKVRERQPANVATHASATTDSKRLEQTATTQAEPEKKRIDETEAAELLTLHSNPPQTGLVGPREPETPRAYLWLGLVLLVVGLGMAWLYVRSIRYAPKPSAITQAYDRNKPRLD